MVYFTALGSATLPASSVRGVSEVGGGREESHPPAEAVVPPGKPEAPAAMMKGQSRGAQTMADSASESSLSSDSARKPRSNSFFSLPRLFVGLTNGAAPDSDPARSPTSPLDCKVFSCLGSYLARSPRSPHCDRVGLGLVDALNDETNGSNLRVLSSATSPRSLPKNYVMKSQTRVGSPLLRPSLPEMAPELPRDRFLEPGKPVKAQPCSMDRSFLARQDLNLDVRLVPPFIRAVNGGSSSGSLPITTHGFTGSLSAGDIEQSEDYTCIISRGPNPKTTHIFGDRILETHTTDLSDVNSNKQEQERRGTSWMVTCSEDPTPSFPSEDFLRVCYCCKKKLEGKDIYMYRGEKAFCSCSCRSQEILVEGEMEEPATGSSASRRSASCDEIFFPGMDVAA